MANPSADDSKPDFSFLDGESHEDTGPSDLPDSLNFETPPDPGNEPEDQPDQQPENAPEERGTPQEADASESPDGEVPVSETPALEAPASETPALEAPAFDAPALEAPSFDHIEVAAVDNIPASFPDIDVSAPPSGAGTDAPSRTKSSSRKRKKDGAQPADKPPATGRSKAARKSAKPAPDKKPARSSDATRPDSSPVRSVGEDSVPRSRFNALLGYAAALTLLFLFLLFTGRLSGTHALESLPDIKPLEPGEFQSVPSTAALPRNHELQLGESQRFGDVIFTPEKVVLAPLEFASMTDGETVPDMTTRPVMQLQFRLENAATDVAFAPWDVGLMSYRNPEGGGGVDDEVLASSALFVDAKDTSTVRVLNFLHAAESSFDIIGQHSKARLAPGESGQSLIASSDVITEHMATAAGYRWRIHLRKGVNRSSQQGVTTLVDVCFSPQDVQTDDDA